jgi:hypothetical protein
MAHKITPNDIIVLRPNVYIIKSKETTVSTDFELDFQKVSETRKTVKETITAAHQVRGDMVSSDDFRDLKKISTTKQVEGEWDFE